MSRRLAIMLAAFALSMSGLGWTSFAVAITRGADTVWVVLALMIALLTASLPVLAISVLRGDDRKSLFDE